MDSYRYTQTWFINTEVNRKIVDFIDTSKRCSVLEIGCFEGLSSVFFADNLLHHPDSSMICVDPFLTIDTNDHACWMKNEQEQNFDYNITHCSNTTKITVNKTTSDKFFETNMKTFTFIYIDGCHIWDFILRDMENSFKVLEKDGIMWMDDYSSSTNNYESYHVMNKWLSEHEGEYTIIHKGYQLAIRKS
jgi:predicted O-methyltransferase YrrM